MEMHSIKMLQNKKPAQIYNNKHPDLPSPAVMRPDKHAGSRISQYLQLLHLKQNRINRKIDKARIYNLVMFIQQHNLTGEGSIG